MRGGQRIRRAAEHNRGVEAVRNQIGVCVAVPAVDRECIRQIEGSRRSAAGRGVGGPAAVARRIGRELVGVDGRCERALIETGARDGGVRDRLRARQDVDRRRGDIREIQRARLLAAPMREFELFEHLCSTRTVRIGHRDAQVDARDAALVAVDQDRRHRGIAGLHAVRADVTQRLFLDGRERDAVHAPHPRQPGGQLHGGIHRPVVVPSDHRESVAAPEWRGNNGDQALSGLERRDVERLRIDERLNEAIRTAHEDRDADRGRLRHVAVADDERQRQPGRVVTEPRRDVRGSLRVTQRGRCRHDDAGRHGVVQAVAVGVAGQAVRADDRCKRLSATDIGLDTAAESERSAAEGDCEGQKESAARHVPRILRCTKQKGIA